MLFFFHQRRSSVVTANDGQWRYKTVVLHTFHRFLLPSRFFRRFDFPLTANATLLVKYHNFTVRQRAAAATAVLPSRFAAEGPTLHMPDRYFLLSKIINTTTISKKNAFWYFVIYSSSHRKAHVSPGEARLLRDHIPRLLNLLRICCCCNKARSNSGLKAGKKPSAQYAWPDRLSIMRTHCFHQPANLKSRTCWCDAGQDLLASSPVF